LSPLPVPAWIDGTDHRLNRTQARATGNLASPLSSLRGGQSHTCSLWSGCLRQSCL